MHLRCWPKLSQSACHFTKLPWKNGVSYIFQNAKTRIILCTSSVWSGHYCSKIYSAISSDTVTWKHLSDCSTGQANRDLDCAYTPWGLFPHGENQTCYDPQWEETYLLTCPPNRGSNQPAHPRRLIRIFVVHTKKLCKRDQWRFWSDCANAQSDLNLRWAHVSKSTFSDVATLMIYEDLNNKSYFITWKG